MQELLLLLQQHLRTSGRLTATALKILQWTTTFEVFMSQEVGRMSNLITQRPGVVQLVHLLRPLRLPREAQIINKLVLVEQYLVLHQG